MIYEIWANSAFTAIERDDDLISGLTANPDGDDADNLLEYAFNTLPKTRDASLPLAQVISVSGQSYLSLTFRRRISTLDLTYAVETSGDLSTWTTINTPVGAPVNNGDGTETVTIRDLVPFSGASHHFIHLKVSRSF
jgi:hypothetical protein